MAVQINNGLFEIFEIFYLEKDSEIDLKYQKATSIGARAVSFLINHDIKINDLLNQNNLISNLTNNDFIISKNQDIYLCICDKEVFSFVLMEKTSQANQKFQAAFDGDVIIANVSLQNIVGLGDFWDGQKVINTI